MFPDGVRLHAVWGQARPMIERRNGVTRSRESPDGVNDGIVGHIVAHHGDKCKYAYLRQIEPYASVSSGKVDIDLGTPRKIGHDRISIASTRSG
jgi:hypothetical protein